MFDTDPLLPVSPAESRDFALAFDLTNEADVDLVRARMRDRNALSPDLSDFRDNGGKLILYNGWADTVVGAMRTVNYYEDVARTVGGDIQDFARLFMVPGMHHCIPWDRAFDPGPVPKESEMFSALISWVESGVPPDSFTGETVTPPALFSREIITRPICAYPKVARQIDPDGSETDATNFHCVTPDRDADGMLDAADNCLEVANPDQTDTDGDGYGNTCDADHNNDGAVGIPDFNVFRAQFGLTDEDPGFNPAADHNGDGAVGIPDFNVFRSYFGEAPGPSGLGCAGTVPCRAP